MPNHEFDIRRDPRDNMQDVSGENLGESVSGYLNLLRRHGKIAFPPDARYLALAARFASAEITIAQRLGVHLQNVTLVDRDFPPNMKQFAEQRYPEVQLVSSGLFTYLSDTQSQDNALVTMIGGDYILDQPGALQALVELLPRVVCRNAVVYVETNAVKQMTHVWNTYGFMRVEPKYEPLYSFNPK